MRPHIKISILLYALSDFISAALAWSGLFVFRKFKIEANPFDLDLLLNDQKFFIGVIAIPLMWLVFYFVIGSYSDIYRKSRLTEFGKTFLASLIGVTIIFFALLLDDRVSTYKNYYQLFSILISMHFLLTLIGRMIILNIAKNRLEKGIVGYNTLLIGGNEKATGLYKEINERDKSLGYKFKGFIEINGNRTNGLGDYIPNLGGLQDIQPVVQKEAIEEVIIAIETSEHHKINQIMNSLAEKDVVIKIIPDMYDILSGSVKMNHVIGAVLIEIYPDLMPNWQKVIKRALDLLISGILLLVLSPFFLYIALRVKLSSSGPVFYKQTRIGINGKPFEIIKFRSMQTDAEKDGPALSSTHDNRVTGWGKIMRKWRLDELPQFYNVLKGEMSLVGPRPERQFFIDQIVEVAPHYKHLLKVQPGITSWGMVKYGYAENLDQMVQRLRYDVLYIENMSLAIDFKILIYTVLTVIQGKGK